MSDAKDDILQVSSMDKVDEYFKIKDSLKALRNDLKDHKVQMEEVKELDKVQKEVKKLREKIKEDETVHDLTEKIATVKERIDLVKELIRIDLLDGGQEEVKRNGRKLKLVSIIKEVKDTESKGKKAAPGGNIFRN